MSGRTAGKLIRAQKVRYTEDKIYSENIVSYHTDAIKSDYAYFLHNISILEVSNPISRLEVSKPTEE